MSDDEPLPPGVNPDDSNDDDDDKDDSSIPPPPGESPEALNDPAGAAKRCDSPYSMGDSLSEPESDDDLVAPPGLSDELLPPGVDDGEPKTLPAPKPIPPPPRCALNDELCKRLTERKVNCFFIETMVNLGLPQEAFQALAENPHPNLLCREMVKRHLWPPPPPGVLDDLPDLELFDDPEGTVFPEGLHTLIKRLSPLHDEEGTPLTRLPPGSVPLIEMASRLYGDPVQRHRDPAPPKYRIPSPEYVPSSALPDRPETPPPPEPAPVTESKKRVKKLLEQKLAARKAQLELKQTTKNFNFSHLVNMRNALRREEKEEFVLPRDDENVVSMANLLNDESSQEDSDVSSNLHARSSPSSSVMEEGEITSPEKPTGPTKIHINTSRASRLATASPARIGSAMKRAFSPDDFADSILKRRERRKRWDVLPIGAKLDASDEMEASLSPTEKLSGPVKLETSKWKECFDGEVNAPKSTKPIDRKDALRKLSFGTEEEELEKRREEEKRLAEERKTREVLEQTSRQQMEAEAKVKEQEERQRRKREQQDADRKRLEELEAKRRTREVKDVKVTRKDLKVESRNDKASRERDSEERERYSDRRDSKKSSSDVRGHRSANAVSSSVEDRDTKTHKKSSKDRDAEDDRAKKDEVAAEAKASDQKQKPSAAEENRAEANSTAAEDSAKVEEKVASINPKLKELAKAMEVAVGPVGVSQERLLEMVLKTLLKEIQTPQGSGSVLAAVASTAAADGAQTAEAEESEKPKSSTADSAGILKPKEEPAGDAGQAKIKQEPSADGRAIKRESAPSVQSNSEPGEKGSAVASEGSGKSSKKKKKKDKKSKNRRSNESAEVNESPTKAESYGDDEIETVVDRTFKRHLRFPIFGIRLTETEPRLKFSANLPHQKDLIALVDRIRPVESIVSRRTTVEPIKTLDRLGPLNNEKLISPDLNKMADLDRPGLADEAEYLESELMDTVALGIGVSEGDEDSQVSKPVNKKNLIEIKPTPASSETEGATYTGNLLEVPIVCAAESTSSPSSAGQSSAVSQQDSPESTTGPPKSATGLAQKPKATRAKSVSFFDGTAPEKDPEVRSPPPPSPSLVERRRNRQGQKVPLLPPADLIMATQGMKRPGSPPPAPVPPPPPGRPSVLYIDNPITHQLYEVIHPGNGLVMTPGGLADVRADPATHKYIYADVEGTEEAGPVLVENFMPRVHLFPYLAQAMAATGGRP